MWHYFKQCFVCWSSFETVNNGLIVSSWLWGNSICWLNSHWSVWISLMAGYFLMRHNILGIRKPGWNLCWGYAEDLRCEVSNLWCGGVAFEHFFCPLSWEFVAVDIWIWLYKELGSFEFNCAEYWVSPSSQQLFRSYKTIYNSGGLFSFRFVFSWYYSSPHQSIYDNRS